MSVRTTTRSSYGGIFVSPGNQKQNYINNPRARNVAILERRVVVTAVGKLQLSMGDDDDGTDNNNNDDNNDNTDSPFDAEMLSNRIREVEQSESENLNEFTSGLQQRVRELQAAKAIEEELFDNNESNTSSSSSLPVICFDALLPNQKLEGSTTDTTFIRFLLEETGLGGWFVMVSFEYRSRKVRRNGVLCKVEFLDAAARQRVDDDNNGNGNDNDKNNDINDATTANLFRRLPTSVRFVIAGKRRCRVAGEEKALQSRIGRWRRHYDENGEESVLGWGPERFTDLLPTSLEEGNNNNSSSNIINPDVAAAAKGSMTTTTHQGPQSTDPKQWSKTKIIFINNDDDDDNSNSCNNAIEESTLKKAESLVPYVEEWYNLASNVKTYHNTNVTVASRIQRDQPLLRVDPKAVLRKVLNDLGDRPDPRTDPNRFCFWAGALINPLPVLGVSLEIRGNLLEVRTLEERLKILELGLLRSIQNLKGERPL